MSEATTSSKEDTETLCQCCGRREGHRIGPSCSKRYVCDQCLEDPSPTFEGCKHGGGGCRDNCVYASVFINRGEDVYCTMPPEQLKEVQVTCPWYDEYEGADWRRED